MTLSVTQLNSSQVQEVLCNQLSIYMWTDVPGRIVLTWVTLSPADRNPLTVPEPYVTGKCHACRRPPLPRKECRSIPVDSTVNIQSTSVNIQSTYSQHTVNIKVFSAENFWFFVYKRAWCYAIKTYFIDLNKMMRVVQILTPFLKKTKGFLWKAWLCWLCVDCMLTVCWLYVDCVLTVCWLYVHGIFSVYSIYGLYLVPDVRDIVSLREHV